MSELLLDYITYSKYCSRAVCETHTPISLNELHSFPSGTNCYNQIIGSIWDMVRTDESVRKLSSRTRTSYTIVYRKLKCLANK